MLGTRVLFVLLSSLSQEECKRNYIIPKLYNYKSFFLIRVIFKNELIKSYQLSSF